MLQVKQPLPKTSDLGLDSTSIAWTLVNKSDYTILPPHLFSMCVHMIMFERFFLLKASSKGNVFVSIVRLHLYQRYSSSSFKLKHQFNQTTLDILFTIHCVDLYKFGSFHYDCDNIAGISRSLCFNWFHHVRVPFMFFIKFCRIYYGMKPRSHCLWAATIIFCGCKYVWIHNYTVFSGILPSASRTIFSRKRGHKSVLLTLFDAAVINPPGFISGCICPKMYTEFQIFKVYARDQRCCSFFILIRWLLPLPNLGNSPDVSSWAQEEMFRASSDIHRNICGDAVSFTLSASMEDFYIQGHRSFLVDVY